MDGIVQIETTHALNGNEKIEIKDINGKIVYDLNANNWIQNSSNKLFLNLGDSLRGIFFITLTNDKGIFSTKLTLN